MVYCRNLYYNQHFKWRIVWLKNKRNSNKIVKLGIAGLKISLKLDIKNLNLFT